MMPVGPTGAWVGLDQRGTDGVSYPFGGASNVHRPTPTGRVGAVAEASGLLFPGLG